MRHFLVIFIQCDLNDIKTPSNHKFGSQGIWSQVIVHALLLHRHTLPNCKINPKSSQILDFLLYLECVQVGVN